MEMISFFYNILFTLACFFPFLLGMILFLHTKKQIYFYTGILFLILVFDNLIIYMTEFIPWFSRIYDTSFLTAPTLKTVIYAIDLGCHIRIQETLLERRSLPQLRIPFIFFCMAMLVFPMLPDSPWKVWLFFLPSQLFLILMAVCCLRIQDESSDQLSMEQGYRKMMIGIAILAVLIILEDTVVIFHYDDYSDLALDINNRSFSDNILSLYMVAYTSRVLIQKLQDAFAHTADTAIPEVTMCQPTLPERPPAADLVDILTDKPPVDTGEDYSKFYLFCKEYQLTAREQDILSLLLEDRNNQDIADALMISIGTAKTHVHNIFQKIDVTRRSQLLAFYQKFEPEKK